jgi:hypothetical protein
MNTPIGGRYGFGDPCLSIIPRRLRKCKEIERETTRLDNPEALRPAFFLCDACHKLAHINSPHSDVDSIRVFARRRLCSHEVMK